MPANPDIAVQKKHLRERVLAQRERLAPDLRRQLDARIAGHLAALVEALQPRVLGFCWPFRSEPDLRDWVIGWLAADRQRRAALPVVLAPANPMLYRQWNADSAMATDRHGIPHPREGDTLLPDTVLVPLNAFDAAGYRIGYGGGYFDRTLASQRPRPRTIGVGYELGRCASALPQAHDLPMDWIVTEMGHFAARAARSSP